MNEGARHLTIRDASAPDEPSIAQVIEAAFAELPHSLHNEARIVDALRGADALTLSLVGLMDASVVGHVAFSPVLVDGFDTGWFGLGPVSVLPAHQRCGVGPALIRAGLTRLAKMTARGCVVLGDPEYYCRFGFMPDPDLVYTHAPAKYFQRLVLRGPVASGVVSYHPAFAVP
jgi:putative acetyltransferase